MRKLGLDDQGILELMAVIDLMSGIGSFVGGLRVPRDKKPWYG